ncbi:helicase [Burkholderia sp. DN3021]|uniref:helicase n=1 Tax=Burkholderia sp. DN3021 TaxID=3410137 RepID=UPI003C7D29A3
MLLVGGYVTADRTCKADPVCRGSDTPAASAAESGLHASPDPVLPVLPVPVYPFHSTDGTQLAANPQRDGPSAGEPANRMPVAQAAPSIREPGRTHTKVVRVKDWRRSRDPAHRTHAIRRVSLHTGHGHGHGHSRRNASDKTDIAKLYAGH